MELNTAISPPMDITSYKSISSVKTSRVSIQPENKTSLSLVGSNTSDLYFSLPGGRPNSFLAGAESFLTFTYTFEGTTATASSSVQICNGSPQSFIRNLETTAGSTSLELINDYNALGCLIDDFQPDSRTKTLGSILEDKSTSLHKEGINRLTTVAGDTGYTQKRRVCFPLMSMVVGTTGEKYFPCGEDLGLRLRLTFEAPDVALKCTTGAIPTNLGYTIDDITFEATYLETTDSVYRSLKSESGGVWKIPGTAVSSFQTTVGSGSTANTLLIPARFSSVQNMISICRTNASITSKDANSTGGRNRDNVSSYIYRIGGKNYPNMEVPADAFTSSEVMCELLKCFHSLHNTAQSVGFTASEWVSSLETATTGAFALGVSLEEPGFSSAQMSGLDTNGSNTFLEVKYASGSSASTWNTFCFYDQIIEIDTRTGEVMVSR